LVARSPREACWPDPLRRRRLDAAENNLSGAVTGSYDISSNWTLALGLGSVVRTADASERYSDRIPASKAQMSAEFMGNPNLDPERSVQGDAWLDGRFERFALHVGVFGRKIYDYITIHATGLPRRLPLSPNTVFQYVNGKATFRGFDASATAALNDVLTLDASISTLHGNDDELNEPVIGVSPLRTSLGLRYEERAGRFYVEGVVNVVAEQDEVSSSCGEMATDGYQTGDLRAGFGLANGVTLRGGMLNVWDTDYADHLNAKNPFTGIPVAEPGRVLFLDLAWSF
jgi:iron complex outermembrane receptor protein